MPGIDLYGVYLSPPVRGVALTAKALNLDINLIKTNRMGKKPEFLAINPMHCIPTIKDGNFTLWESRPIQTYLVQKYGSDSGFYPEQLEKRATVDRLLYFDIGTLFFRWSKFMGPVLFKNQKPDAEALANVKDALSMLDNELAGKDFVLGNSATVADHSLVATVTTIEAAEVLNMNKFKNVSAWLNRCKSWSYYDQDIKTGVEEIGGFIKPKLAAH